MDEELKGLAKDFDTLRVQFNTVRSKGLLLSKEQQKQFIAEVSDHRQRLKQIQATNAHGRIATSELARREVLIVNLENAIRNASLNVYSASSRSIESTKKAAYDSIESGGYAEIGTEVVNPMELSGNGLMMYSQAKIDEQDQIIAEIGSGVERIHQKATHIGDEATRQNLLLANLDNDVEAGVDALREEAAHAEAVRRKSKTCHLWMCIIAEVGILLILLLVYINHGK